MGHSLHFPGQHLATENIRAGPVEIGIKPHESRKAALFQLAARPWSSYIATRPGLQ